MTVTATDARVRGCNEVESSLCHDVGLALVTRAGALLCAQKPCALFNIVAHDPEWLDLDAGELLMTLKTVIGAYREELVHYGIRIETLGITGTKVALLAWRPLLVTRVLGRPRSREFLAERGYDVTSGCAVMAELVSRLRAYYDGQDGKAATGKACCGQCGSQSRCDHARAGRENADSAPFPHEVGLLLGYPLEDVRGFVEGRQETARGPWKAYGDPDKARERFERMRAIEGRTKSLYQQGRPLCELICRA